MTALSVSALNGVKVYNLSAGKTLPQWLEQTKSGNARALRHNTEFKKRLELIQNLDFPTASTHIKMSADGNYLAACGVYKPQMKLYDLSQLSLKCERHLDAAVVDFDILSHGYDKMVFLRSDRTIEFHARWGKLHSLRIPKFGRELAYHSLSCDLLVASSDSEVYRLNLEQGQFVAGFHTSLNEVEAIAINPRHGLIACGGSNTTVELWDHRDHSRAATLSVHESMAAVDPQLSIKLRDHEVTSLAYCNDGLSMAVGTSTGHVMLYDLRSSRPMLIKDHRYDESIKDIKFHETSNNVISTDSKTIRLWNRISGDALTSIQPTCAVHSLCIVKDTGLIFAAGEQSRVPTYYIPSLGNAPKWCSFLDNLTEELEEQSESSVYDEYQFVTRQDIESLGLTHLIGSKVMRSYMHGYFMDIRLWRKVKAAANPFEYENYVKKRVQERIAARRAERITVRNKLPSVNASYAQALLQTPSNQHTLDAATKLSLTDADEAEHTVSTTAKNPLGDERFSRMFSNPDFEIKTDADDFQRLKRSNHKLMGVVEDKNTEDITTFSDNESNIDSQYETNSENEDKMYQRKPQNNTKQRKNHQRQEAVLRPQNTDMKMSLQQRVLGLKEKANTHIVETDDRFTENHGRFPVKNLGAGSRSLQFVPSNMRNDLVDKREKKKRGSYRGVRRRR